MFRLRGLKFKDFLKYNKNYRPLGVSNLANRFSLRNIVRRDVNFDTQLLFRRFKKTLRKDDE